MVRFCAKSRSRITSSSPPWLTANTFGTLPSGGDNWPARVTMRMRPGRSVTSMRPSGRKASDQGCTRPPAMVSTAILPAEEGKIGGAATAPRGSGSSKAASNRSKRIPVSIGPASTMRDRGEFRQSPPD